MLLSILSSLFFASNALAGSPDSMEGATIGKPMPTSGWQFAAAGVYERSAMYNGKLQAKYTAVMCPGSTKVQSLEAEILGAAAYETVLAHHQATGWTVLPGQTRVYEGKPSSLLVSSQGVSRLLTAYGDSATLRSTPDAAC